MICDEILFERRDVSFYLVNIMNRILILFHRKLRLCVRSGELRNSDTLI